MTDTADEWMSHREAIRQAARRGGHVLINGLGLGLVVEAMLRNPVRQVEHMTVIELSEDVIRLVGSYLAERYGSRLRIVQDDAFAWRPPENARFTVVWHDLWHRPDPDVLPQVDRLEQIYAERCDWQGSWPREYVRGMG